MKSWLLKHRHVTNYPPSDPSGVNERHRLVTSVKTGAVDLRVPRLALSIRTSRRRDAFPSISNALCDTLCDFAAYASSNVADRRILSGACGLRLLQVS
jgi:hypothetical protein